MNFAVIVFLTDADILASHGVIYGWYESMATAIATAVNLRQSGSYAHAVAMRTV